MLFCNGCWDKKELNQLALVQMMAIDYDAGNYQVTLQLILPSAEKETVTGDNLWAMTGEGASVGDAIQKISLAAPRELYLDHLDLVLLGEGLLEQNIEQGLDYLLKENVLRRRTSLLAVQGNAGALLSNSAELAKMDIFYIDNLLKDQSRRIYHSDAMINTYYLSVYNGIQDTFVIPRILLDGDKDVQNMRLEGAALIQGGKLAAWADREWMLGYYWVNGGKEILTLQHDELAHTENEAGIVGQGAAAKQHRQVVVELEKKKCRWELVSEDPLKMRVTMRSDIKIISGYDSWRDSKEADAICRQIQQLVEQKAMLQIQNSFSQAKHNQTDAFRLGRWLYAWHPYLIQEDRWPEQFATIPIEIRLDTNIIV